MSMMHPRQVMILKPKEIEMLWPGRYATIEEILRWDEKRKIKEFCTEMCAIPYLPDES